MQKKLQKKFFDLEIIAFELVVLNTRFCWERTLLIGCQYVNKESQKFHILLKQIFFELIIFQNDQKYDENTALRIYVVFRTL